MKKFKENKELSSIIHDFRRFSNSVLKNNGFFVDFANAYFSHPLSYSSSITDTISSAISSDSPKYSLLRPMTCSFAMPCSFHEIPPFV